MDKEEEEDVGADEDTQNFVAGLDDLSFVALMFAVQSDDAHSEKDLKESNED